MLAVWKKKTLTGHFLVIYFLVMTVLYGVQTTLQGPRHRIQIDGLIVIFQYYGILALVRRSFRLVRSVGVPADRPELRGRQYGEAHDGAFPQPERGA